LLLFEVAGVDDDWGRPVESAAKLAAPLLPFECGIGWFRGVVDTAEEGAGDTAEEGAGDTAEEGGGIEGLDGLWEKES